MIGSLFYHIHVVTDVYSKIIAFIFSIATTHKPLINITLCVSELWYIHDWYQSSDLQIWAVVNIPFLEETS